VKSGVEVGAKAADHPHHSGPNRRHVGVARVLARIHMRKLAIAFTVMLLTAGIWNSPARALTQTVSIHSVYQLMLERAGCDQADICDTGKMLNCIRGLPVQNVHARYALRTRKVQLSVQKTQLVACRQVTQVCAPPCPTMRIYVYG